MRDTGSRVFIRLLSHLRCDHRNEASVATAVMLGYARCIVTFIVALGTNCIVNPAGRPDSHEEENIRISCLTY